MLRKLVLCTSLLFTANSFAAKDPLVATVNGKKIYKSDVDKAYLMNKYVISNDTVTTKKVLTDLINRSLGIDKAKKNSLQKTKVVKEKMEDVLFNAQVSKDLEPEFKRITVSDADVKRFYKEYPEYRTAHILLRVRVAPSPNELDAAMKQIFKIHNEISKDPKKFAALANKYSQSPNAETGGDIGYKPAFFLAPEYREAIKGKKVGFISKPVRTQFGYHIIKVLGVKDFKEIDVPVYKKFVYDRKKEAIIKKYFAKMRKSASIKIHDKKLR